MKKIFFIALSLIITSGLFAQKGAVEKYFKGFKDNDNFTSVYISKSMFKLMSEKKDASKSNEIINSLEGLDILTTEKEAKFFFNSAKRILSTKGYDELLRVKEKDSNVLLLAKDSDGKIAKELVFLVLDDSEAVLMSFVGNIPLDKISELGSTVKFGNNNFFKDLDNK